MIIKYITLISGFNYFLFSIVVLFRKTPARRDNLILGSLFLLMSIYSFLLSFYNTALLESDYGFLGYYLPVDYILITLMGPFFYFYINVLLNRDIKFQPIRLILHALPVIPALVFIGYFISLPRIERIDLLLLNFEKGIWQITFLNALFYIQMTVYLIICFRLIRQQLKVSETILKDTTVVDVSWLKTLIIIDLVIMIGSAPLSFLIANEKATNIIAQLAMDIQLIYIFFKSTWQTGLFSTENVKAEIKSKESVLKISDNIAEDYLKTLLIYMEEKKPYLLEDCTIQNVSEKTGISVHHLSNILNKRFDKNFSDFINEFRINEAKRLLSSGEYSKMTLEAIGYECGFGSKSNFNKAFKKLTNQTPSEFRTQSKS